MFHTFTCNCRLQSVLLVSVKFFLSLARAGLVEELRHLYVVVILWSAPCARSKNLEVKVLVEFCSFSQSLKFFFSSEPSEIL